jgi:hypothetical protein
MFSAPDAPNPQEVADAIAKLIDMPAGQRPRRTTVDRMGTGRGVEAINGVCAEVQTQVARMVGG